MPDLTGETFLLLADSNFAGSNIEYQALVQEDAVAKTIAAGFMGISGATLLGNVALCYGDLITNTDQIGDLILGVGSNDWQGSYADPDDYETNYQTLIDDYVLGGVGPVRNTYIVTPINALNGTDTNTHGATLAEYQQKTKDVADANSIVWLDGGLYSQSPDDFLDDVHLTDLARQVLWDAIVAMIVADKVP